MDAAAHAYRAAEAPREAFGHQHGQGAFPVPRPLGHLRNFAGRGQSRCPHMRSAAHKAGVEVAALRRKPQGELQPALPRMEFAFALCGMGPPVIHTPV